MKFEFSTEVDGAKEAAALAAALAVLHGPAVAEALEGAADTLAVDGRPSTMQELLRTDISDPSVPVVEKGTTATQEEVEGIDAFGIPWDARIHSSTKGMNKDGSWSRRRNTPDDVFDKVMKELQGAGETMVEPNAAEAFAPEAPAEPVAPPPPPAPTETAASPVPPPPPAPTASADPITFPKLMVKITKAQTAQTIDAAKVIEFLGMFGLSAVKELASAPAETIQAVNDLVDAHVGA